MTPERAEAILREVIAALGLFIEEAELIDAKHTGSATHLLASIKQTRASLKQLIARQPPP